MEHGSSARARPLFAVRLAIGLAQGFALYALYERRMALAPEAFEALWFTAWVVPVVALGAVGALRGATLAGWLGAASLLSLGIGAYAGFVGPSFDLDNGHGRELTPVALTLLTPTALFILHHLIVPADAERRWRASFSRYFDEGWRDAVRLALAGVFVGGLWLLLTLGAGLFNAIKLEFFGKLIAKRWFAFTVTTSFFAIGIHLTDVRADMVRGARTLLLSLLSWLLPILVLLTVGFLGALLFTGLKPLWATRWATGTLLSASAALIILINAAYQDGEHPGFPPGLLRWSTRAAGAVLPFLVGLAGYALILRVGQHGWTPPRVYAAATLLVGACYAAGYLRAALSRGAWMQPLETFNWITAQVAVLVLVLISSPVADPVRLSVHDQVTRLERGGVSPDAFDFAFLRFHSGRLGHLALRQLAAAKGDSRAKSIAELAQAEARERTPYWSAPATPARRSNIILAVGEGFPQSFFTQSWTRDEDPITGCQNRCVATTVRLVDGASTQVIVFGPFTRRVYAERDGRWTEIGQLAGPVCVTDLAAVRSGRIRLLPRAAQADVEVNGMRLVFAPSSPCPPLRGSAEAVVGQVRAASED